MSIRNYRFCAVLGHLRLKSTARHPSVDITDTTPAHTAAALRPDRHHTHGHQVAIVGWHLYEPYGEQSFCTLTARHGLALEDLRCWAHTHNLWRCGTVRPSAQSSVGMARTSCGRAKSNVELFAPPDDTNG